MGRYYKARLGRWPSGQWQQTVNLPGFALRVFESHPAHQQEPREIGVFFISGGQRKLSERESNLARNRQRTGTRTGTSKR